MNTLLEKKRLLEEYKSKRANQIKEDNSNEIAVIILKLNRKELELRRLVDEEEHKRKTDSVKSFMFC